MGHARATGAFVAGALLLASLPLLLPAYPRFVLTLILLNVIAVVGLGLVMGFAGLVSLGHAGFAAVGAYATALLVTEGGMSYWPALVLGGALACGVGFVVGLPALRLEPLYLAMATFGFGQSVFLVVLNWVALTRGPNGLRLPAPAGPTGPMDADGMYWVVAAIVLATVAVAYRLTRTRVGRALMGLRESEIAAATAGVNPRAYKTFAFAISAAYAGLAGGLYAGVTRFITPDNFIFPVSLLYVTMGVVGGMGSVAGNVVGATALTVLPEVLRGFAHYRELLAGIVLLAFLIFLPDGVAGVARGRAGRTAVGPQPGRRRGASVPADRAPTAVGAPAAAPRTVLHVDGVRKAFGGVLALADVSLEVREGTIHGLIGPNGSGKTTLFNVVTRVYPADGGAVWLDGSDLRTVPIFGLARRGIARTFQNLQLFPRLTVLENVLIGMHTRFQTHPVRTILATRAARREEEDAAEEARRWLAFVGFEGPLDRPAGALAFGHLRLVELARALASRPRVLLLDEPSAGLTAGEIEALGATIRRIRDELGVTVVLVAHTMRLVMGLSDIVSVLDHGVKIAEGTPDAVRANPEVVQAYLGQAEDGEAGGTAHA
jgi:branched-chain amino acid transport system permease protein